MTIQNNKIIYFSILLLIIGFSEKGLYAETIISPPTCKTLFHNGQGVVYPGGNNTITYDSCINCFLENGYAKIYAFHDPMPCEGCIGQSGGCGYRITMPGCGYNFLSSSRRLLLSGDLGEDRFFLHIGDTTYNSPGEYQVASINRVSLGALSSDIKDGNVGFVYVVTTHGNQSNDECISLFDTEEIQSELINCICTSSEERPLFVVKGSFSVVNNPREDFDLFNFQFSPTEAASGMSYFLPIQYESNRFPFTRAYDVGQWNLETCNCDERNETATWFITKDMETFRVKIPSWQRDVWTSVLDWKVEGIPMAGLPGYMSSAGWAASLQHKRIWVSIGSFGTIYFNHDVASDTSDFPESFKISSIVKVPAGAVYEQGTTLWRFAYDEDEKGQRHLSYIYNGSDPNHPEQSERYYTLLWGNNYRTVQQKYFNTAINPGDPLRVWNVSFDSKGRMVESSSGCSSGCGGGSIGHERIEYHDSFDNYNNLINKKFNANGDVIQKNDYRVFRYGPSWPEHSIRILNSSFEFPNIGDGQLQYGAPEKWEIFYGQEESIKVLNPSDIQIGSRYNPSASIPCGEQVLTLSEGAVQINLSDIGVVMDTTYFMELETNAYNDPNIGNFVAKLVAYDPNDPNAPAAELIVIEASEENPSAGFGSQLIAGEWVRQEGFWDSSDHPELVGKLFRIILEGNHVDIDMISLSAVTFLGGETRPLLVQQIATPKSPAEPNVVFVTWDYNCGDYTAVERRWIDNQAARVTKYQYKDGTFGKITAKTVYENLNEDPSSPNGPAYTTLYTTRVCPDDNTVLIKETLYPSGKRKDVERSRSGRVIVTYTEDIETGKKANYQAYTYSGNDIKTHTDARGGVTEYSYWQSGLISEQKEPMTNAGQRVTRYGYDDARRIKWQEQEDSSGMWIRTTYNYNSTTGFLDSVIVDDDYESYPEPYIGKKATSQYFYNDFGQVVREISPDGIVTGKSYGLGGELKSEFVIASDSESTLIDEDLTLISQAWYIYDDDGRIEFVKRVKSDETFSYGNPEVVGDSLIWIKTHYEYDFLGRKKTVIEDVDGLSLKTTYEYNNQGEVIRTTYANGKWTETYRNGRGLVILQIVGHDELENDEWQIMEFEYDADGNLLKQIDSMGTITLYQYDNLGRVTKVQKGVDHE